jgi:Tfp pilus assembly protein FimT
MKIRIKYSDRQTRRSRGYTLVEIMVIVIIMAVVMQVTVGILIVLVRQQSAVVRLTDIKSEGDRIMARMKNEISTQAVSTKATISATPTLVCIDPTDIYDSTNVYFGTSDASSDLTYALSGQDLTQVVGASSETLNSPKTTISDLNISCSWPSQFSDRIIAVSFTIASRAPGGVEGDRASMTYRGFVTIVPP